MSEYLYQNVADISKFFRKAFAGDFITYELNSVVECPRNTRWSTLVLDYRLLARFWRFRISGTRFLSTFEKSSPDKSSRFITYRKNLSANRCSAPQSRPYLPHALWIVSQLFFHETNVLMHRLKSKKKKMLSTDMIRYQWKIMGKKSRRRGRKSGWITRKRLGSTVNSLLKPVNVGTGWNLEKEPKKGEPFVRK